jgi:malonyl-CoA/methylmalonyl-CoA synthetase
VSARILDEHGETVPPGEVGQLHIRGPSVFDGYLDDDDATRRALDDGWMSTGDLARIDEQDRYFLVGRVGDMIISGGLNVYPAEVEATLRSLLPEVEAVVFGLSDPDLGERVCCATTAPIDEAAVTRALRQAFAPYKLPRRWFVVPEIPRNTMGKIQRGALAAACARG